MVAIFKKELRSYFNSMIGFIFTAIFLIIVGVFFSVYNLVNGYSNFEYVLDTIQFLFIIIVPILTMRLVAEENKQKTDQLLLTSPLSVEKIIFGKYLAVLVMFLMAMALVMLYPLILMQFGAVQLGTAYSSLFGFTMLGAAFLAIGLFISSLTENQVIALVITAVVILFSNLMSGVAAMIPTDHTTAFLIFSVLLIVVCLVAYLGMQNMMLAFSIGIFGEIALTVIYLVHPAAYDGLVAKALGCMSIGSRYSNFVLGIMDLNSIIYYLSIIFLFLFFTIQVIKKRRWN